MPSMYRDAEEFVPSNWGRFGVLFLLSAENAPVARRSYKSAREKIEDGADRRWTGRSKKNEQEELGPEHRLAELMMTMTLFKN